MRYCRLIVLLLLCCQATVALAQDPIADAREQLQEELRNSDIGAGYAQMLNFFIEPSISASRLDADDGTRYDVFKVPLQMDIPINEDDWLLALRGTLSHARADSTFSLLDGETIDGSWTADSGQLGLGLLVPVGEHWRWIVAGHYGISRMENEADYRGPLSEVVVAPIADGVLFNWDTNARIASLTGGVDYQGRLWERYDVEAFARYTHSRIESYSESDDLVPFSADTGTFSVKGNLEHSLRASLGKSPLFGIAHAGFTAFTGPNRKALGFGHFYELGYSLGLDVSDRNRFFQSFSLGYQFNFGSDIEGHSILFGWKLK